MQVVRHGVDRRVETDVVQGRRIELVVTALTN